MQGAPAGAGRPHGIISIRPAATAATNPAQPSRADPFQLFEMAQKVGLLSQLKATPLRFLTVALVAFVL